MNWLNTQNQKQLNAKGQTEAEFLSSYDASKYEKPSMTVDDLIFTVMDKEEDNYRKVPQKELQILLVKRKDHPFLGFWAIPGGFVGMDETLEEASLRELKEETNVEGVYLEQLFTWGEVKRDPRMRVITVSYMALVDSSKLNIQAGDDAEDAQWFSVKRTVAEENKKKTQLGYTKTKVIELVLHNDSLNETLYAKVLIETEVKGAVKETQMKVLESKGLAFDHAQVINYGLDRLANKLEYTAIAFNLLPEYFTFIELQKLYEIILDKDLLPANFRREMIKARKVIETDQYSIDNAGHRRAKLYKYNPDWELE